MGNSSTNDVVQNRDLNTKAIITYDYNSPNLEGIVHSNKNIQSSVLIQETLFELPKPLITLGLIPFSDGHGLVALHTTLTHGGNFIVAPYFDIEDFVKIIQRDKPSVILGLPAFYESIINIILKNSDLSHFKLVLCEGEFLDSEEENEINNFLTKYNAPKLTTTYSLPETLSIIAKTESNKIINNSKVQFKLVNSETSEKGVIIVSAPNIFGEYLHDSKRTADVLNEDNDEVTFYTKNQGYFDDDKNIVIIPPVKTKKSSYILSSQYPGQKIMGNKFYTFVKVFFGPLFSLLYSPIVLGSEKIPTTGPMILCGNHRHVLDQCAPMIETSRNVHYLAKKEYFDGSYALFFKLMGCIAVNRQIKDNKATSSALEVLRNGGAVGIFPEGTRNRTNDVLLPFKFGAVSMAKKTNAVIVPFAISGEFKVGSDNGLIVSIGDPFKVDDDLEVANTHLRDVILDLLERNKEYITNKK
jgi:1-acyl-sn-glycerol-3-phosphate acyltransferase